MKAGIRRQNELAGRAKLRFVVWLGKQVLLRPRNPTKSAAGVACLNFHQWWLQGLEANQVRVK